MSEMSAAQLKEMLGLEPHPREGGWFRQTWKAEETIPREALPAARYAGAQVGGDGDLLSARAE